MSQIAWFLEYVEADHAFPNKLTLMLSKTKTYTNVEPLDIFGIVIFIHSIIVI